MKLELTEEEARLLKRLVEEELEQINPEIHHSTTSRVRTELREDRVTLRALLGRFSQDPAVASSFVMP